jgi:hypothetical protein
MEIEVSIGEIVDKLSILEIKKENIKDISKLDNINKEYDYLYKIVFDELKVESDDFNKLYSINLELWKVEDDLREKERNSEFDGVFIELARKVYYTNDERSVIKKDINIKYKSNFIEEKSYSNYTK